MKQTSGKLGMREYVAITILMIGSKATENTPAEIYNNVQNVAWLVPILSGGIFFIPLFLLLKTLSLFQGKDLFTLIQQLLGKYIGFVVLLFVFIITSLVFSFDSRMYTDIIRTFYFSTTPNLIIYAILLFVCAYGAKKGIQYIGSVSYLVIFYVIFATILAILLFTDGSNIQAIFPIFGSGVLDLLKQSIPSTTLFAEFFILTALIPFMSSNKDFQKGTWFAFIFIMIHISSSIFIFVCLFDRSLAGLGFPFHTAIRYVSIGNFLTNVETLFLPIWLMSAFVRFTAMLYICARMFGHLFHIKEFEFLIPALTTIYLLIGMIPESSLDVTLEYKSKIRLLSGPTFAVLSLILWLVALLKGEFTHAKNKKTM